MRYRIEVTDVAEGEIESIYSYLQENAPTFADRWLSGLYEAIATLSDLPFRCARAPESGGAEGEIRQLLYRFNRILYEVRGRTEYVHHVRYIS